MATTSGTVGQTQIDVVKFIEHAARRAGGLATTIAGEQLDAARESLYFFLSHLSNKGVNLWCIENTLLGLYPQQAKYDTPVGTVDLLSAFYRTMTRPEGNASASGGTAEFAFDSDIETTCNTGGANGNISIDYGIDNDQFISTAGILPRVGGSFSPVIEASADGITWTTVYSYGAITLTANVWNWVDLDPSTQKQYWRLRETAGGTLNIEELYFGTAPQEIPMYRMNLDDYTNLPNKSFTSESRSLQFWLDRKMDDPVLNVWPVPLNTFDLLSIWRHRHIMDVGSLTNLIEIPQRWGEAILNGLAYKVSLELPNIDPARRAELKALANETYMEVADEERDHSPIKLAPAIGVYTA